MQLNKTNTYAAYSSRKVVADYKGHVISYLDGTVKDLSFGANHWLSDREVTRANPDSHEIFFQAWHDQVAGADLVVAANQKAPLLTTHNYQRLVNHKPTLTFTDGLGLTAKNPVTDFKDVSISLVIATDFVTSSTIFNFTGENESRFQSHLPWSDDVVYFDYGNYTTDANWRVSFNNTIPIGRFAVVTYVSDFVRAQVLVNGISVAEGIPSASTTPTDRNFVLGASHGIACASGNFTIGEVIITKAALAQDVVKSQLKYFAIS